MQVTAEMVKALRQSTGAGMMDCRKALMEADGDAVEAEKILKRMGLAAVAKRAERATESGRISIRSSKNAIALASVACETDFVARSDAFKKAADDIAEYVLENDVAEDDAHIQDIVNGLISIIKENMGVRRIVRMALGEGEHADWYIHGEGSSGAIVKFKCDKPECFSDARVKAFMHDMALHVTAFAPQFLDESAIGVKFREEQMEIFRAQTASLDKPDKVKEGIVMGKYSALLKEVCLMDQGFVKEEKMSVRQMLKQVSSQAGCVLEITDYVYVKAGV